MKLPTRLVSTLLTAACLVFAGPVFSAAHAQAAATKPAAAKPVKPSKPSKAAPAAALLPKASAEQLEAAGLTHFGTYECEFAQTVEVALDAKNEGYVQVRLAKQNWLMKPVLSSTGAIRLEDVRGRMLMLQIANKSMVMDVQAGRRLVDDCVHEKQRESNQAVKGGTATPSTLLTPK